jgi:hypothetical protein
MILMTICPVESDYEDYCSETHYDPLKIQKPDPIWFEGHLWQPVLIEHCENCPCGRDKKYRD